MDRPPCCAPAAPDGRRPTDDPPRTQPIALGPVGGTGVGEAGIELVEVPAGTFTMGNDGVDADPADGESPAHEVELPAFGIGRYAVTNDEFARFVAATGHRTSAERYGSSFVFAGLLPDDFPPTRAVAAAPWWREVEGASWERPEGPQSTIEGRDRHPVVHVSWEDALAFAAWARCRLPTEAEWERAARGGLAGQPFPWGGDLEPGGEHRMNVYQGSFPTTDLAADGWAGTCPVGTYPPNGLGLHEVTGNVWEWCQDWFSPTTYRTSPRSAPTGPAGGSARVMRGGSYLCHESYCRRYRVDARSSNTPDSSTGNLGFRVARDLPEP